MRRHALFVRVLLAATLSPRLAIAQDANIAIPTARVETLLREWQAPCSDGSEGVPSTIAPTRGFNREHVKH